MIAAPASAQVAPAPEATPATTQQAVAPTSAAAQTAPATTPATVAEPGSPTTTTAQDIAAAQAPAAATQDIVVTGSRIATPGLTSPTPVTALNSDQLVKASPSTLTEALRTLPALVNSSGPQRNSGTVNGGQSFLDLRTLGPSRTLTLLNGERFVAGALNGSVDVNLIPSALLKRVDIVTGGASAAYGSDAVAGVVNFILDTRYQGLKFDGYYGISQQGDNQETKLSAAYGTSFAGGRGHLVFSGEYFKNDGVRPQDRTWSDQGHYYLNGPAGGPKLIEAYNVRTVGTYGGMILNGNGGTAAANAAFTGQFTPSGALVPYSFGSYRSGALQIGGDGVDTALVQDLVRPLERKDFYGHGEFDITDHITIFGEALWGESYSKYVSALNRNQIGNVLTIQRDNAFLPQSVRDQMTANGLTSFTFLRQSRERGFVYGENDVRTQRYVGGARGDLGSWKWDFHAQYGRSKADTYIDNVQNTKNLALAIDAVVNPANGAIVCRSTLTNPNNGCVPYDGFGEGQPSSAALDYITGRSQSTSILTETEGELNFSGPLFEEWAGPVTAAVGGEYRRETALITSDPLSQASAFLFGNPLPWAGHYIVKEAYLETIVPLLRDSRFGKQLELNAAGRVTDYSTSGTIPSWKVGLSYTPVEGLRIRATRSRDIRAPNVSELFSAGRQATSSPTDPFNGGVLVPGVPTITSGNSTLKPEKADTFTAGVVFEPRSVRGFTLSVDYYNIKVNDAIQTVAAQMLLDQCYAGNQLACSQIVRSPGGTLTRLLAVPLNLSQVSTNGVDLDIGYRHSAGNIIGPDTQASIRGIVSYVPNFITTIPGSAPVNTAGQVGISANPKWSGSTQLNLSSDFLSMFLQGRLIGGGLWDVTKTDADTNFNHIKAQFYLDAQVSYKLPVFQRRAEIYLDIRNLLDHDPPFAPGNGNVAYPTNPSLYDLVGRAFRFGFRFRM